MWWTVPVIVVAAVALSACGSGDIADDTSPGGAVEIEVGEWYVRAGASTALGGLVEFDAENTGSMPHEFVVVKTDVAPGKIPVSGGVFDENDPSIQVVDEIAQWPAGDTRTLSVELERGKYQLVCNLPGHYSLGMWTAFSVT